MDKHQPSSDLHPGHRSIRLKNVDYSQTNLCLATICSYDHKYIFGEIANSVASLSALGNIVHESWAEIGV
jgi:hypothetical protein